GCTGGLGIRPLNTLEISGKDFYAGKVEAIALTTVGSNSTLDASKVTGTTFIDDFFIRSGTLLASNFHINNFTVWKANANFVSSVHPTAGSGYSAIESHIGKSFINYLSLEIGTSHTVDNAALWFRQGGDILNYNLIEARATSYANMSNIDFVNVNTLNTTEARLYLKNAIFNTITNKKGQTIIAPDTIIEANALNINTLLHLKNGSKHGGILNITLHGNEEVNQDFSKYLNVEVDSATLQGMSKEEMQKLITESEANSQANGTAIQKSDYHNASGTYISTNDDRHYLLLPDIMTNEHITNNTTQVINGGNVLIEQTGLKKGTLRNYGTILLDSGFVTGNKPVLTLKGNLDNYHTIDIGAAANINMTGDFTNFGKLIFRIQAHPKDANQTEVMNGQLNIAGNTTFDISMGTPGAFQADIADSKSLTNLKLATANTSASSDSSTYKLINVTNGAINYTYTQGDYTTTFNATTHNNTQVYNISTENNTQECTHSNCVITHADGTTQQETFFTTNHANNPWDMDKANVDSATGNRIENPVGSYDNLGNLIQKPSQSDKQAACDSTQPDSYCGFGSNKNVSEAERGYNYAQERMKSSFAVTYKGSSIDGKYLQVERVVTDSMIGFRVMRKDLGNFSEGKAETPLCTAQSSSFDCALYMEAGGNNSWINAIKRESANSYEILKDLFYNQDSSLLFLINLDQTLAASRNLDYFLEIGRTLDSTFEHVSDLRSKSSTLNTLSLAMESSRVNRLTKVSAIHGVGIPISNQEEILAFKTYQKNLEQALIIANKIKEANQARKLAFEEEQKSLDTAFLISQDSVHDTNKSKETNTHSNPINANAYDSEQAHSYEVSSLMPSYPTHLYTANSPFSESPNDSGITLFSTPHSLQAFVTQAAYTPLSHAAIMRNQTRGFEQAENKTSQGENPTPNHAQTLAQSESSDNVHTRTLREHSMNSDSMAIAMERVWFENLEDLVTHFNQREQYPNNAWVNVLGNLNFSTSGSAQLYGLNAGYDYFINKIHTAIGGYMGYGYGIFKGNNNGFISNTSNNIFAGLYSRTFIANHEIDITINSAFGFVNEELNSGVPNMELLDLFSQKYGYDIASLESSVSYGYAFNLTKGYIIKPFAGVSYYFLHSSNINHDSAVTSNFLMNTHNNARQALGVIAGLEGRKYWANQSYVFLLGQFKQDVVVLQNNLDNTGHATTQAGITNAGSDAGSIGVQNALSFHYAKDALQSLLFIAGGGEYALGRFYLNGSISLQNTVFEKNFGVGLNLGARVVF
ncbi:autotransporter outer membrane beta-barrel domain-containing protein, partial [Helicobacter sp. MIT 14-3879]|uniref:autotransporter outer membrane beta-barrel domain-containing protein n=1 Tax=Helicobacter sp. MIT 14-3879 TaxID=2040649 RepID=UPI000E1FA65B